MTIVISTERSEWRDLKNEEVHRKVHLFSFMLLISNALTSERCTAKCTSFYSFR